MADQEPLRSWAILDLLGHRRLAGFVQEVQLAGAPILRIDVPDTPAGKGYTQFYPVAALYCLTPTTEEVARAVAARTDERPVQAFEVAPPPSRALPFTLICACVDEGCRCVGPVVAFGVTCEACNQGNHTRPGAHWETGFVQDDEGA